MLGVYQFSGLLRLTSLVVYVGLGSVVDFAIDMECHRSRIKFKAASIIQICTVVCCMNSLK